MPRSPGRNPDPASAEGSRRWARRVLDISPFHVMDILARARAMEAEGRSIIHMEIGEPDFPTPPAIAAAGIAAIEAGYTHYTPALGMQALREAIAASYPSPARPGPDQVVITPGASGALQLACAATINPDDEVLMADPGYPCNRHFVRLFDGIPVNIPVGPESRYQLSLDLVQKNWSPRTRAVLLASPSNPAGTRVPMPVLRDIGQWVQEQGGVLIVDEIYHGLVYGEEDGSLATRDGSAVVINSFSKFYGMTGWRLGWMVVPQDYLEAVDRLAQNMFIAAPTVAQHAALAAFSRETREELEQRRQEFARRRDYLLPALRDLGFEIPVTPDGAFYLYANCSRFTEDSFIFARELLEKAGVAVTPGVDFGEFRAREHVRFSYANTLENLQEGIKRLSEFL